MVMSIPNQVMNYVRQLRKKSTVPTQKYKAEDKVNVSNIGDTLRTDWYMGKSVAKRSNWCLETNKPRALQLILDFFGLRENLSRQLVMELIKRMEAKSERFGLWFFDLINGMPAFMCAYCN